MRRLFLSGLKGGVGTTTILANLATALVQAGESVTCIDLDSKNELRLHFAHAWDNATGWSNLAERAFDEAAFVDQDGVKFIPHGHGDSSLSEKQRMIKTTRNLDCNEDEWVLFDLPSYASAESFELQHDDVLVRVVNCDVNCHSLINQRVFQQTTIPEYLLINRFNGAVDIEVEIARMWRQKLPRVLPVFVHQDEILKEALAYKNVGYNCAPYSVIKDDFQALISWLQMHYAKASP
ncbi:Cellulose synthase, putative [Pseudoalteromonas luteoviolacea B = ATCC 29581]|nr:Cellulose synthase, putative [Pseudoalteromonas luteoviolacea B = ATCC 29581]